MTAGASTAYHLAALGHRVVLLERGDVASGASGVNAGQIDSLGWGHAPDLQAHLTAGSVEIFESVELDHGEDIEFRRSGALQAIHTPEQHDFTRERVRALRARGHRVELLSIREARSLEPESSWPGIFTPARRRPCWPRPIPPAASASARLTDPP